jgi:hypothetical protein
MSHALTTDSWRPFRLGQLFELKKGKRLTKANMTPGDTPYIGAIDSNNGVSAHIGQPANHTKGTITVSYNGSVAEAFYQPQDFWATDDVNVLYPMFDMSPEVALFVCTLIRKEKYRFNYGRKWHLERMRESVIYLPVTPACEPDWSFMAGYIKSLGITVNENAKEPALPVKEPIPLGIENWREFRYSSLFNIERGRGPRCKDLDGTGNTPFITSTDRNNGYTNATKQAPIHAANSIGVNRNGSVGEAFYQPVPFCSTEDVHIFTAQDWWADSMNEFVGLFLCTLIRREKYRYNYGRKWGIERMKESLIKLPVTPDGVPAWNFMERYIKSLPFSSQIEGSRPVFSRADSKQTVRK